MRAEEKTAARAEAAAAIAAARKSAAAEAIAHARGEAAAEMAVMNAAHEEDMRRAGAAVAVARLATAAVGHTDDDCRIASSTLGAAAAAASTAEASASRWSRRGDRSGGSGGIGGGRSGAGASPASDHESASGTQHAACGRWRQHRQATSMNYQVHSSPTGVLTSPRTHSEFKSGVITSQERYVPPSVNGNDSRRSDKSPVLQGVAQEGLGLWESHPDFVRMAGRANGHERHQQ